MKKMDKYNFSLPNGKPKEKLGRLPSGKTVYKYKDPVNLNDQEKLIHKMVYDPEYCEQREAYRRIANLKKGGTDQSKPVTFDRVHIMSKNKKVKASVHETAEHARELRSLKERI